MTPKELEKVLKLMVKYNVDSIKMEGLEINKSLHLSAKTPIKKPSLISPAIISTDEEGTAFNMDEVLFHSSSAPKMNLEDFSRYAAPVVPMKDKS